MASNRFSITARPQFYKIKVLFTALLVFSALLIACDDGDVTVETIDFAEIEANSCSDNAIIYKIKETEAVFFELGEAGAFEQAFQNIPTPEGLPLVYNVNDLNQIYYRAYDGTVSSANFCTLPPPISPNVTEQWTVSDGRIEIETEAVVIQNTDVDLAGGDKIQKYRHNITFKDITWQKPSGEQVEETYDFGAYDTFPNAQVLSFNFDATLDKCASSNTIYNYFGREGISLQINPLLIENAITPLGSPRVGYIGAGNTLNYYFYNPDDATLLSGANFCSGATAPAVIETWIGVDGVQADLTGQIEVTTTSSGPGTYLHDIHLKKVSLRKGNLQILLADDYYMGQLITTD